MGDPPMAEVMGPWTGQHVSYLYMYAFQLFCMRVTGLSKMRNLTVRIDDKTYRDIEETANLDNVDRSTVARNLLKIGLRETKKQRALEKYRKREYTLWKASQVAETSLREMMALIEEHKIPLHITPEDVEDAWREAFEE